MVEKKRRMKAREGQRSLGVNLGSHNYFGEAIGDIAGGNIIKKTYIDKSTNLNFRFPVELSEIVKEESNYCQSIVDTLDDLSKKFVPTNIIAEVFEDQLNKNIPEDFTTYITPQLIGAINSDKTLGTYTYSRKKIKTRIDVKELRSFGNFQLYGALGTGKTTILLMLSYFIARDFLSNTKSHQFDGGSQSCFYGYHKLPVFIDLRNNVNKLSLYDFAKSSLQQNPLGNLFPHYYENGKTYFLIDGIDDLSTSDKLKVRKEIVSALENGNQIAITTRQIDQQIPISTLTIEPFDDSQIQQLFQNYLGVEAGQKLWGTVSVSYPPIKIWLQIPFIAFVAVVIYKLGGYAFEKIENLIQKFLSVILERDVERKAVSEMEQTSFVKNLSNLAYEMVSSGLGSEFHTTHLRKIGFPKKNLTRALEIGIITKLRGNQSYRFINAFVQQFFAGHKLLDLVNTAPKEFDKELRKEVLSKKNIAFNRASLFVPATTSQSHWDAVLPPLPKSKWHDALSIILMSSPENLRNKVIKRIIMISSELAGNLVLQNNFSLDDDVKKILLSELIKLGQNQDTPRRIRIESLRVAGLLNDPRIGDNTMTYIPGGKIDIGYGNTKHNVNISSFFIDIYPVTNQQFSFFMEQKGYETKRFWSESGWYWIKQHQKTMPTYWKDPRYNLPNYPVVGISWYEAYAYSNWAGKRLPTEAEWEAVSTWDFKSSKKRKFPTGNDFFEEIGNLLVGEYVFNTTPVGAYPKGKSAEGVYDLVGNVWEWLSSEYKEYPYIASDGREEMEGERYRCLRGGSWGLDQVPGAICTERHKANSNTDENPNIGFRCVKKA